MRSVDTAFRVLEAVGELQPVGATAIAAHLNISKTSAHRFLHALGNQGWLRIADPDTVRWGLTSQVLALAGQYVEGSDLRELAEGPMQELNARTGETVHLLIREGTNVVLLHKIDSTKAVRPWSYVGGRRPVHVTASGKAILAHLPEAELEETIRLLSWDRYTATTTADADALREQLSRIREDGFASNLGEWRSEVSAFAAAILAPDGYPTAAISLSVPSHSLTESARSEFGPLVAAAATAAAGKPWPRIAQQER